ncbi:LysR family transcriptional regulator [Cognatishimia sp. F0-27]|uniref:LysR substrate-binding domain-containing protein n=1 Tax=Cognatishimia sp. F0-27 TaxID=2816855 RepID=UPI001D0C73FD|nr:LysR family transcriptional regulator [Cognatishimia sp. F0-27]MCC1492882.1 LysR family transcriptional regulator [Cognatishimia sp. F0-27]
MIQPDDLSLKWLASFRAVLRCGSIRGAADRLGLVPSTVSYHIARLEAVTGVALLTEERPVTPTFEGEALLACADEAFAALERGLFRLSAPRLSGYAQTIQIAAIEDLDADVVPALSHALKARLPACGLVFTTRPSHEIRRMVANGEAHIGIAAETGEQQAFAGEVRLLHDPFILVAPAEAGLDAQTLLAGGSGLRFLRYGAGQYMRRRIDAELARRRIALAPAEEYDSSAAILGTIATGGAWTITTALNYARLSRLHGALRPMALPKGAFSRRIALFHTPSFPQELAILVRGLMVPMLIERVITPTRKQAPWLGDSFAIDSAAML